MAPVGSFVFSVPGSRCATDPATLTTNSGRFRLAIAWASGASALSMTTWVIPCRSRRSRKISWPWSRRRWTQPESRATVPASAARSAPQVCVRYGVARRSAGTSDVPRASGGESVMTGVSYGSSPDRRGGAMLSDHPVYATLPTADMEALRRFYEDVLVFAVRSETPAGIYYQAGDGTYFAIT